MKRARFYVETYGCTANKADSELLKESLQRKGYKEASLEEADMIIVNTCGVKEKTEHEMLKRIRKLNSQALSTGKKLFIAGCLPSISGARIKEISKDIEFLDSLNSKTLDCSIEARTNKLVSIIPLSRGCLGNCSYCATRHARGSLCSYPLKEIKNRFSQDIEKGVKEFWLTSQDLGVYGYDIECSLPELLRELLEMEGDYRIRLGMMNPQHLKAFANEMISLLNDDRLYSFLHVPIQSGSNKVLARMRRGYTIEEVGGLLAGIRKRVDRLTFSTDIIVGFPGETEQDFIETAQAMKELEPDVTNVSRYGDRPYTEAAGMPCKVPGGIVKDRSRKISYIAMGLSLASNKALQGLSERMYCSARGWKGNYVCRSKEYRPVIITEDLIGKHVKATVTRAFPTYVEATIDQAF